MYKGERIHQLEPPFSFNATHLIPHDRDNNKWWLPISLNCLYEDLLNAIDLYASLIPKDPILESKFQQTANALTDPQETRLCWW